MNPDLLNIITSQAARASIGTVGLVGSHARGESRPWHDVDLFVTVPLERAAAFGAALAAALNRVVHLHDFARTPWFHPYHLCARWLNCTALPVCPCPPNARIRTARGQGPFRIEADAAQIPHFAPMRELPATSHGADSLRFVPPPRIPPLSRESHAVSPPKPHVIPSEPSHPILVFYHLANLPGWETLFAEQMQALQDSGLLDAAHRIVINSALPTKTLKAAVRWLARKRNVVLRHDTLATLAEGEIGTLRMLWEDVQAFREDAFVLYFHGKGLSHPGNLAVRDWRRVLEYFCVEQWRGAVAELEAGTDIAGVNWEEHPHPHFSGNFWWARSEYILSLPPLQRHALIGEVEQFPTALFSPRHDAEMWPGSGQPRVVQLHRTGFQSSQHYAYPYFRERYAARKPNPSLPLAFHYYHLFLPSGAERRGLDIFDEHMTELLMSGLQQKLERMIVIVVSRWANARNEVLRRAPQVQVWQVACGHEMATHIRLQADLATIPDEALIFYAHSKGVTYSERDPRGPDELRKATDWRRTMSNICVTLWPEAVRPLIDDDFDVSGAFYLTPERWKPHCAAMGIAFGDCPFFGGNFWWARAGFLKILPKVELNADRFFAERWIGMMPHRAASAFYNMWPGEDAYRSVLDTAHAPCPESAVAGCTGKF